jgi:hypothetical protein
VHRSSSPTRYAPLYTSPVPRSEVMIAESKENLLAVATILSTESRHSAWLDSALGQGSAWSGPFDVISVFNDAIQP